MGLSLQSGKAMVSDNAPLHFFYKTIAHDIYNYTITETNLHQILYSTAQILTLSDIQRTSTPIMGEDCLYSIFEKENLN